MIKVLDESYASDIARLEGSCLGEQAWTENCIRQEFLNTFSTYVAYCIKDNVVATAGVRVIGDCAEINNVAVDARYRRQGIAFALMRWLVDYCRQCGAGIISLEVDVSNIAAIALYVKTGFAITALRKNFYSHSDGHSDAYTMQLTL